MAVASLFEDLLDQYKIEQHLADKRYTELYQAYDVDDDRLVRLDVLRPGVADDNGFVARFVNRARAVAQVRHPSIIPIYHIGKTVDGLPYVAQAHIDGLPLSQRLDQLAQRNTPVNAIYALKLVRQLADALVLAERLELFHYDLQPENVLLKNVALPTDDSLVLLDLFIPPDRGASREQDASGASFAYLSPEQRAGKEIGAASHVYSLGTLLFRLLSGQMPERPIGWPEAVLRRMTSRPTALERQRPGLSPLIYQLVERSIRREPGRRYESVEEFLFALDAALAAEEALVGVDSGRMAYGRRSWAWLLPLLLLGLLLVAAVLSARSHAGRADVAQPVAIAESEPTMPATPAPAPAIAPEQATAAPGGVVVETATAVAPDPTDVPPTARVEPTAPPDTATPSPQPTQTATSAPSPTRVPVVRVTLNQVNLRRGPGVNYTVLGSVRGGDRLQVLAWNNDARNPWYLVATDDQRLGWVSVDVVESDGQVALAAIPVAATLPPTPFPTSTPLPTPTATVMATTTPTAALGGGNPGDSEEPQPTRPAPPTEEPSPEPSATPPPLP